jgi:hypothetical protein
MVPDVLQQLLLAGVAVDSPADAAALHPVLFETVASADHAFHRAGLNRQFPIGNSYRDLAVKPARYRRSGRGRSWQSVWWIYGTDDQAKGLLEEAFGVVVGWESCC